MRWNEDRAASAAQEGRPLLRTYSGPLQHSLDQLSQRVLGSSLVRDYTKPREYTGKNDTYTCPRREMFVPD